MNKTVNINLAGIFFHIDEDAYLKLQRYLEAIKRSFTDSQGRSEIIADIEARIAELFAERIQNEKQVVGIKLVDEVITIMGQPEDYLVDDEIFEDEPQQRQTYRSKSTKKLFRDTDNSYIGGVSAGLGHYLGLDVLWVRLLWILLAIGSGGTFIFIYLIFWALVPEALTTAEKLTMTGDPVNISNIEKKIKDGIDTVSEKVRHVDLKKQGDKLKEGFDNVSDNISDSVKNVDFQKQGNKLKSSSQTFFDTIGNILMFFLKVAAKFIGIILIMVGVSTLLALIVAFFTVGITDAIHFPPMNFIDASNAANIPMWLMSLLLFFAIGIPFFFVFYLGLKILVNNLKSIGNVAKFTLVGLWFIAIIGLIITGIKQATEHAFDANVTETAELNIKATDTLKLSMVSHDGFNNYFYRSRNDYQFLEKDDGKTILSRNVRLIVRSTADSLASIQIEKEASGSNYEIARQRARNINYGYTLKNNKLKLDAFLTTSVDNKFSEQEVMVILYLPKNSILYADENTHSFHQNSSYYNDILDTGMEEHYLRVIEDDVECIDCSDFSNISNDEVPEIKIKSEGEPEVRIQINEEDGVNIEVNDN
ncbi:PspC domain-containing protein [Winogradskyella sp. DF17]|uniref:PspC domain-containing protein n=1 Tax=Winogradskyella pelagia TaxID=2819984 RepID=A0ABS3T2F7_9FLAO|nr:PspC domain-containing protein [Winogradskyella sp. DF17]MBO3116629.1 PspC domain-containing protein [Winogradskyella sp. DF17]